MTNLLNDLFKFLSSLWCAIVLIVAVAVIIAAGTMIESYYGTEAAQILVYHTSWFSIVLVLIAINLLTSAMSRWPWRKQHIGFLTTHLGIISILVGSLITQRFAIDGQLSIAEGESGSRITLASSVLEIFSSHSKDHWVVDLKPSALAWSGRQKLHIESKDQLSVFVLKDYPKAMAEETVQPSPYPSRGGNKINIPLPPGEGERSLGEGGSPALHFALIGSMAQNDGWLFLNDPERNQSAMGAALVRFDKEPIQIVKAAKKNKKEAMYLEFKFDSRKSVRLPISESSVSKSFNLEGTKNRVTIERVLRDAIVDNNQLKDRSKEWRNPAVELTLEGDGGLKETHTVFSNFPEFQTIHSKKPSAAGVHISMKAPNQPSVSASKNELRFIFQQNGLPRYQIKKGESITDGTVELNKKMTTGWMDFQFSVDQYYPSAVLENHFTPLPQTSQRSDAMRVIELELTDGHESKTVWVRIGEARKISLGDRDWHVVYGLQTKPLGFTITLKDFMMDTDPGTNRPASFKSDVTLKDIAKGITRDQIIQMNEPLIHRGLKVYQSAYQITEGQPDISVFTVASDPGIEIKYAGAIIMILGIILLFYFKQYSTLRTSDPKMRKM